MADKFIQTESIKTTVVNMLCGNMKIVEEYAQRIADEKVEEDRKQTVISLFNKGLSIEDIADYTQFKLSFVREVLNSV